MALSVTNIADLNPAQTAALLDYFKQLMQESHPEVELSRGAFHDLVLYFNSVLNGAVQENISRVLQSNSLLSIAQNPELADPELVDKVLSNYNLARATGTAASGEAVVVFNQAAVTQINAQIKLNANGVGFYPDINYVAVPPGENTESQGYREMIPVGDGTFAIKIAVVAETPGIAGNVARGTAFAPDIAPSNVASIYAAADFTNGTEPPSNADYIAKLPSGLTAKTIGGRRAFVALIKSQPAFQNINHISIVGMGDAEQKRDQRGLFPVSGGGRIDIYMQTNDTAQRTDHLLFANYVGPASPGDDTAGTVWRMPISLNVAPGFYRVLRVNKIGDEPSAGYEIINEERSYSLDANTSYSPDIVSVVESEYTRYKELAVTFIDTDKAPSAVPANSTAAYSVTILGLPLIGQVQDFLNSREVRCRTADVIVKSAVPCFTTISFKIRRAADELNPDFAAIKKAIVQAVAKIGFTGRLSASTISSAAHQYLSAAQTVSDLDIFGRIQRPDGKIIYLRNGAGIEIPNDPDNLVSPKTTVFYVSEDDIEIGTEVLSGFND
jgi:hypothetical protein